ncbi:MAG: hypothetical protein ACLFUO_01295 [Candidatus Woesearchaeota archaeon]
MNTRQFANLHSTLKSSFGAVRDDITKLKKRDGTLKQELAEIRRNIANSVTRDEFFTYVKNLDEQIERSVDVATLNKTEAKIVQDFNTNFSSLNEDVTGLKDRFDTYHNEFNSRVESLEKDFSKQLDDIRSEMKKTEDLKKEVKEVKSFKKQVSDLEKTFAKKKSLDEAFQEQDEIYDLIEELENRVLKKKDIESYQKLVDDKLKKFRDQMNEVEIVAENLNRKLKDLDDYERDIRKLGDSFSKISMQMDKLDPSDKVASIGIQLKENRSVLNAFEKKLNEVVDITNEANESQVERMVSDEFYKEGDIEELDYEEPEPVKSDSIVLKSTQRRSSDKEEIRPLSDLLVRDEEPKERKGFFARIMNWFFEEVPEDEDEEKSVSDKIEDKRSKKAEKDEIETVKTEKKSPEKKNYSKIDKNDSSGKKVAKSYKESKVSKDKPETEIKAEKKSETKKESKSEEPEKKDISKKGPKGTEKEIRIETSEKTEEGERKRGFFGRIVDWFLEDEEELEPEKEAKEEPKDEAKNNSKKNNKKKE